jgi:hypothetical protein
MQCVQCNAKCIAYILFCNAQRYLFNAHGNELVIVCIAMQQTHSLCDILQCTSLSVQYSATALMLSRRCTMRLACMLCSMNIIRSCVQCNTPALMLFP